MAGINCHCGSALEFSNCCKPYISGKNNAPTPEALMRSRYSAYAVHNADYLWETTAPKVRKHHSRGAILQWAESNHWVRLEIISASENIVEFKAYYLDVNLKAQVHHERSAFVKEGGRWYYLDGEY